MEKTDKITVKEGYEAMLHTLQYYYQLTGSNDLTDILSGGQYLPDEKPADSAFWEYWIESVQKAINGESLNKK